MKTDKKKTKFAVLGLVALALGACQTTASVDNSAAVAAIKAGDQDIDVAPIPLRAFNRSDGSQCEEYRYYRSGVVVARQGKAVICRYEGQRWILVSRKMDKVPGKDGDEKPDMPDDRKGKWKPVTGFKHVPVDWFGRA